MLKIWGRRDSGNVEKVMWTAAELGVRFELINAGGNHGQLEEPWFRKLNPNGRVPVIDDEGFVLWESNVIVRYLAQKHDDGGICP